MLAFRDRLSGFHPNLVLTTIPRTAPLTEASLTALLAAGAQHPAAHVHAVDAWDLDETDAAPRGRRIVFSYRADDALDVVVHEWVWATGAHHVHLSASCLPSQVAAFGPTFEWVAQQMHLTAPASAITDAAARTGAAETDATASERAGFSLEDLAAVRNPAFRSRGPVVDANALQALLTASRKARIGSARGVLARADRETEVAAQLNDAGWIDAHARVTRDGADVADTPSTNRLVLLVKARRDHRAELLIAYAGRERVLVLHGPSLEEAALDSESQRYAALVSPEQLPSFVARWVGLRPFWPFSDAGERVSSDDVQRHIATTGNEETEGWTELLFRHGRDERYVTLSPSRGFLRICPPEAGEHPPRAEPSAALYQFVLAACATSLGAAGRRRPSRILGRGL